MRAAARGSGGPRGGRAARRGAAAQGGAAAGIVIIALLCAVELGLAFRSGAYSPADWLPFVIGVAALAVMVAVSGPSAPSSRFQRVLLGLFGLLALWTVVSIFWATSLGNAWEEINRTLFYATAVGLVFVAVRWSGPAGLRILATLVAAAIAIMALVMVIRLATDDAPADFFLTGRLSYPVSYHNGLAALLMIGFWLAMGMANGFRQSGRRFPAWAQPVLLAFAVFFAELALLPQSRGALWTFFLVAPFFVILSPHRFRALVDLGIVVLPVVLFWGRLNAAYAAATAKTPLHAPLSDALLGICYSVAIVLGAWAVTWLVERFAGPLARRARLWLTIVLVVLAVAGLVGGLIYADARTDGLGGYLDDRWAEFTGDQAPSPELTTRFTALGLSGRIEQWEVAARAFEEHPLLGIGAQNFELYHYQFRTAPLDVRNPHSQPMQLLAEMGFPGLVLYLAFVVLTLVWAALLRFRGLRNAPAAPGGAAGRDAARDLATHAVIAAMMTAVISWFIHSSADWLWQLTSVTLPAMMLFAGLVAAGGRRRRAAAAGADVSVPARKILRAGRRACLPRPLFALVALAILISAALPYLCIRYCDFAAGSDDLTTLTARAQTAEKLDPTSVLPFSVRAGAHRAAALEAPEGSTERVEQFKLAAAAWWEATGQEPGSWLYFYLAAESCVAARDAALAAGDTAAAEELAQSARGFLEEAGRLNPLSRQVEALRAAL